MLCYCCFFFCFKQKTAYEMRISDWSSDVCSSDLDQRCRSRDASAQNAGRPAVRRYRRNIRARRLPCIGSCGLRHWPGLVSRWRFAAVRRRAQCRAAGKSRRKIMVLERAELQIRAGMEIDFATAMAERGLVVLRSVPGVESVRMGRGVENPGTFMQIGRAHV